MSFGGSMVLASALFLRPSFPSPQAPEKFVAECADRKTQASTCDTLAHDVYAIVLGNLRLLEIAGLSVEKTILREALKSSDGALQAVALRLLIASKPTEAQDLARIEALIESPVPAVRAEVFR